jgi:hypothetical protein
MENNRRDDLERMIDAALPAYSDAEPLAGLEQRVLSRIAMAGSAGRRRRMWLPLALAASASVAAGLLGIALRTERRTSPEIAVVKRAPARGVFPETPPAPQVRHARTARPRRTSPKALPRQERFPAVSPITSQERALLALVTQHPAEVRDAFAELQKRSREPVEIQAIVIPPLRTDGAQ